MIPSKAGYRYGQDARSLKTGLRNKIKDVKA